MAHSHRTQPRHQTQAQSVLWYAAALTLAFAALEALGGWWTGSLALVSDAGHMLTDGGALVLSALAGWLARRPPSRRHSYGYGRAEVFAAILNAGTMLALGAAIAYAAYARLGQPREIQGAATAVIALAGLAVNLGIMKWLAPHRHDMNARAAALHVLGDALGSIGALASGVVIALSGWTPIDAIASLLICALIAASSLRLLRERFGIDHVTLQPEPPAWSVTRVPVPDPRRAKG